MTAPDPDQIRAALAYISPDDRGTRHIMAVAVKGALGDNGLDLWLDWSSRADSYREKDARAAWRSLPVRRERMAGAVFYTAFMNGWRPKTVSNVVKLRSRAERAAFEQTRAVFAAPDASERSE